MNNEKELYDKYEEFILLSHYGKNLVLKEQHRLRLLAIELTMRCNARCEHCCVDSDSKIRENEITTEEIKKVITDIANHYDPRSICIGFTGGEPLLRKDIVELAKFIGDLGFSMTLTTNGTLLTESMIKKLYDAKLRSVCISIDGLEKTHEEFRKLPGCYQKILKSLKTMKQYDKMEVGVTTVVNKKNIEELEALYKQFCDIGIDFWRVFNVEPLGRAAENKEIILDREEYGRMFNFIEEKKREGKIAVLYGCSHFLGYEYERKVRPGGCYFCGTGVEVCSIMSNGDIFGCSNIPRHKQVIQGNIRKDNFVDVWENRFEIFRDINFKKKGRCSQCSYWRYCLGGASHTYDYDNDKQLLCLKDILKF